MLSAVCLPYKASTVHVCVLRIGLRFRLLEEQDCHQHRHRTENYECLIFTASSDVGKGRGERTRREEVMLGEKVRIRRGSDCFQSRRKDERNLTFDSDSYSSLSPSLPTPGNVISWEY